MSLFDNIKKSALNIVSEEVEENPKIIQTSIPIIQESKIIQSPNSNLIDIAKIDASSSEKLTSAISEAQKSVGTQYYTELNDTLSTLAEDIPSEDARYKAAIKLLIKDGATSTSILNEINACISAIEEKSKEFYDNCTNRINSLNNSNQTKTNELKSSAESKKQQIQSLQIEITSLEEQINKEANSINIEIEKTNQTKNRFIIIYNKFHDELFEKQKKISGLLK